MYIQVYIIFSSHFFVYPHLLEALVLYCGLGWINHVSHSSTVLISHVVPMQLEKTCWKLTFGCFQVRILVL